MDESLFVLFIGLMQIGGLLVLAWYHLGVVKKQVDAVKMLAAFHKANHPADLLVMEDIISGEQKKEKIEIQPEEPQLRATELDELGLAEVRSQM